MKSISELKTMAAGGLALVAQLAVAQTWQTVLDFQQVGPWNQGLVVAPSGTIFASGLSNSRLEYVFASQDGGTTWFGPLDESRAFPTSLAYGGAPIACDSTGTLYVPVQGAASYSGPGMWTVRQGTDGGTNWTTVDDYTFVGSGSYCYPNAVAADAAGNIFVAGGVSYTNSTQAWTVRKGIGGTNWFTVDTFPPAGSGWAQAIFAHPTAGVFAVGKRSITLIRNNKQSTSQDWIVRRSVDDGVTWATVDAFQLASGQDAEANGIGADANGCLYVVGFADGAAYKGGPYVHWIVRRSVDGGNTWATVDDFPGAWATRFTADSKGNLFVAGQSGSLTSTSWIVRENPAGTSTWATVDNFQYAAGSQNSPQAIAADALGSVFVGGYTETSGVFWLIRKN
jgi:hypothetical protein